jgi:hypothetical protein
MAKKNKKDELEIGQTVWVVDIDRYLVPVACVVTEYEGWDSAYFKVDKYDVEFDLDIMYADVFYDWREHEIICFKVEQEALGYIEEVELEKKILKVINEEDLDLVQLRKIWGIISNNK